MIVYPNQGGSKILKQKICFFFEVYKFPKGTASRYFEKFYSQPFIKPSVDWYHLSLESETILEYWAGTSPKLF
jgi:hypothetical protein